MKLTYEASFDYILSEIHDKNWRCDQCPLNIRFVRKTGEPGSYCYRSYIREDQILLGLINNGVYPKPPSKDTIIKRIMTKYKYIKNIEE